MTNSHRQTAKTLSVEMKIARDCDIRAVADSMPEVIYRFGNERSNRVVYKAYVFNMPFVAIGGHPITICCINESQQCRLTWRSVCTNGT